MVYRRRHTILDDCAAAATAVSRSELVDHAGFLQEAIACVRSGHWWPAQALAANLLDSMLHAHLDAALKKVVTDQMKGAGKQKQPRVSDDLLDELSLDHALVAIPIWRSYVRYFPSEGDPVPQAFARHASAHGVSRRQYSKRNTIIAIMLAASMLLWLDANLS